MDCLQLMLLCFLLLIAAPHSNIAMPKANHAERMQDSSAGETNVTVYLCEDRKSSVCHKMAYEGCEKIFHTQNDTCSHKTFRLEPSETSISLCYHYPPGIPEGIIGIVWHNAKGIGTSCSTVNCEAFSENVMDGITETCCEVEINFRKANSHLKCYHKMAGNKDRESSTDIPDEGNVENHLPVIDEQSSSSVIVTPVLMVIVCGVALGVYCVRRRRNGRDIFPFNSAAVGAVGKKTTQAPDIPHTYLRNIYS